MWRDLLRRLFCWHDWRRDVTVAIVSGGRVVRRERCDHCKAARTVYDAKGATWKR